jgi:hypothetical protein
MMNTMKAGQGVPSWPKQDLQAHVAFMRRFARQLHESGELVSAEGLAFPNQAKLVKAGKDGTPITDGVFPEGKEFLAGYWIVMWTLRSAPTPSLPRPRPRRDPEERP